MSYLHGVGNSEVATSLTTPTTSSAGLQVIFGTAPIHLAKDPYKAANTPKLCYSFAECQEALGYSDDFENFTLCQSMDANFRVYNNSPIVLVNVLDPNKAAHTTENAEETVTVTGGMATYTKQYVLLPSLVVKNDATPLAADVDYTAAHDDDGNVTIVLLSTTAKEATALKITSKSIKPSGVTKTDVVGGVNSSTHEETGLEIIRQVYPKFGLVPGLIIAPGWSQDATVAAALQAKVEQLNGCFDLNTILDIPANSDGATVYTDCKQAKEKQGFSTNHGICLWPRVLVGEKKYYFSAMAAAHTVWLDTSNDGVPYESPSNKSLRITGLCLDDGTEVLLDKQQADDVLGANGICTAINVNGFKFWGNNTCAYPSTTDTKDRFWCVRRFFDWDGNNFILTYFQKVDKPENRRLVQDIVDSTNITGSGYVARGYCAGYKMKFLEDENPTTELLAGHLTVHTHMAPFVPTEYIHNIREYDTDALSTIFS